MNCDPLAKVYQSLEYIAFRRHLERQRVAFLGDTRTAKRALLLGDGDGRFLLSLAKSNPAIQIDCLEASAEMISLARERLHRAHLPAADRVYFEQGDARLGKWPGNGYDLVVTHFFLDCFSTEEVSRLIEAVRSVCAPGAKWLIAEFHIPASGWRKWHARCWLRCMYWFFGIAAGLKTRRLPEYRTAMRSAGFFLAGRKLTLAQLISSELWELPSEDQPLSSVRLSALQTHSA